MRGKQDETPSHAAALRCLPNGAVATPPQGLRGSALEALHNNLAERRLGGHASGTWPWTVWNVWTASRAMDIATGLAMVRYEPISPPPAYDQRTPEV